MGKSVGAGYQEWDALAADPAPLDEPIRPLIQALNECGWALTVFSCAGHPEEPDSIQKGRRQAHIDLLISDPPAWKSFVQTLKSNAHGVRVTEASLGDIPRWLVTPPGTWRYRRLVLEPLPYNQPPAACRATLDSAINSALESLTPRTSHASTH